MEKVLLGHCPVDSGQILMVDPCYADEGFDYEAVCCSHTVGHVGEASKEHRHAVTGDLITDWGGHSYHNGYGGETQAMSGVRGNGVVTGTGWGDGVYPVYGFVEDGRVMGVYIEFDTDKARDIAETLGIA
jgi:hypothetical protein